MATAVKKRATSAARSYSPEEIRVRSVVERNLASVRDLVRSYDVEFRENFAGEPGVYVTLRVPKPNDAEPKRVRRLLLFWQRVRREILDEDTSIFPYVTLAGTAHR